MPVELSEEPERFIFVLAVVRFGCGSLNTKSVNDGMWVDQDHLEDLSLYEIVVFDLLPFAEALVVVNVDTSIICRLVFTQPKLDVFDVDFCLNLVQKTL